MTREPGSEIEKTVDKYELIEKVGEGGMAVVYRARHSALGREVAVKLLHPHLSQKERNRLRFEREARAIESLEHEHILRIYDYSGRESKECFIVTEFIQGLTLKSILTTNTKIPSEVAAMIAIHLCEALAYAHERGIIHRDIKPENVMIRQDGVVKLMDFGIARVLDESSVTITGGLVGSPAYMSPEQASDAAIDERSDLFSLGTLLYRSVTGHLPFVGGSPPVILRNILDGNFPDPQDLEPGIDPGLAEIIRKALETDPEKRYQTAAEMSIDLVETLQQSDVPYGPNEILHYTSGPREYEDWLRDHLGKRLAERGQEMISEGNTVSAMKLFNRALYLNEENEAVLALIQSLHKTRRPISRYLVATLCICLVPVGAVIALGIGQHSTFWSHRAVLVTPTPQQQPGSSTLPTRNPGMEDDAGVSPASPTPDWTRRLEDDENSLLAETLGPDPASGFIAVSQATFSESKTPTNVDQNLPVPKEPQNANKTARATDTVPGEPQIPRKHPRHPSERIEHKEPDTRPALIHIRSVPFAEVFINGESYGNSMLRTEPISLPAGDYQIRLVNPRCETKELQLKLTQGQLFEELFHLDPLPAQLTISNLEARTKLYLDDTFLGVFSELEQPIPIRRPRNVHTLRAILPDGSSREWTIPKLDHKASYSIDGRARTP